MKERQVALPSSKQDDHHHQFSRNSTNSWCNLQTVWYGECQRNQAANVGGFAVDGCREFMPCGEEGSTGALTCAACGCHRNFHRREVVPDTIYGYCSSRGSGST